jgi:ubiquinone/menaquinone biosynthesis C-methylase UbiE
MHTSDFFDARAQHWDSDPMKITRATAVADGIRSMVPLSPEFRALEYGCGTGLLSFALQPYLGRITLADSSPGMLEVLSGKVAAAGMTNMQPFRLDLASEPPPQEKYDLVYTLMTLHHIEDTDKILQDFFSLLTRPGYCCVVDLDTEDGSFHGPEFHGHRGFNREELARKARRIGFVRVKCTTVFHIPGKGGPGQGGYPLFLMLAEK